MFNRLDSFALRILKLSTCRNIIAKNSVLSFLPISRPSLRGLVSRPTAQTAIYTGDTKTIEKYCCWEILPKRNWRRTLVLSPSVSMKLKFPAMDRTWNTRLLRSRATLLRLLYAALCARIRRRSPSYLRVFLRDI